MVMQKRCTPIHLSLPRCDCHDHAWPLDACISPNFTRNYRILLTLSFFAIICTHCNESTPSGAQLYILVFNITALAHFGAAKSDAYVEYDKIWTSWTPITHIIDTIICFWQWIDGFELRDMSCIFIQLSKFPSKPVEVSATDVISGAMNPDSLQLWM